MHTSLRAPRRESSFDADVAEWPPSDTRIKLYERALDRDPRNHFLLLDLAREYARHRRLRDVCQTLERVAELFPTSAMIHARVAAAYAAARLPEPAIEHYRRSLEIDPQQSTADDIMGEVARLSKRPPMPIAMLAAQ